MRLVPRKVNCFSSFTDLYALVADSSTNRPHSRCPGVGHPGGRGGRHGHTWATPASAVAYRMKMNNNAKQIIDHLTLDVYTIL